MVIVGGGSRKEGSLFICEAMGKASLEGNTGLRLERCSLSQASKLKVSIHNRKDEDVACSVVTGYCIGGRRKKMRLERKLGPSRLSFDF